MSQPPLESLGPNHAALGWRDVLVSYYPTRVTVAGLEAVHRLHLEQRARHPRGTATLGIVGSGIPIPGRDVRGFAARIGRASSSDLRGECIVLEGHPFWVSMGRSAFRAIQLVSRAWHPREVFGELAPAARWSIDRVCGDPASVGELVSATHDLVARWHDAHGRVSGHAP